MPHQPVTKYSLQNHDEFRRDEPILTATSYNHLREIITAIEPEAGWVYWARIGPTQDLVRGDEVWASGSLDELKLKLAAHYGQTP